MMNKVLTHVLVDKATATGNKEAVMLNSRYKTFQVTGKVSASTGSAEVEIQVSNDKVNFVTVDTLSLTLGTTVTSDSYVNNDAWKYVRGNVKTLTGTDAEVTVIVGTQY